MGAVGDVSSCGVRWHHVRFTVNTSSRLTNRRVSLPPSPAGGHEEDDIRESTDCVTDSQGRRVGYVLRLVYLKF